MSPEQNIEHSAAVTDVFAAHQALGQQAGVETVLLPMYRGAPIDPEQSAIGREYVHGDTRIQSVAAIRTGLRPDMSDDPAKGDVYHVVTIKDGRAAARVALMHIDPDQAHPVFVGEVTGDFLRVGRSHGNAKGLHTSPDAFDVRRTDGGKISIVGRSRQDTEVLRASKSTEPVEEASVAAAAIADVIPDIRRQIHAGRHRAPKHQNHFAAAR